MPANDTLIGRAHPAGVLQTEISRATDSHGGLVLVTGEAGIGKTTLVTGAVHEARRTGALVLSGSCWDSDSAPGYWPWVQVIRALGRSATPEEWSNARKAAGTGLSVLLGELPGTEPVEGFGLYDAVTTALVSVSHSRPVVVVLDDLHWADTASLKLLEFAAQHTWFERLLLIGTYRDVEVESADHPLRTLMTRLVAKATTVTLTGLGRDEVGALMTRTAGREPDADLVTEVHRRTGGNPFFVEQTARLWHSGGSVTGVAPGVRDAVQRRMSLLPQPVAELLTVAAVLGREFHRQVLAATASAPVPHVDRLLDQAVHARLVTVLGGGRFSFAHDLVREALHDSLDEDRARRLHASVVEALDASPALGERIFPADLARHAYLAGAELDPARVVEHLVAAARDAGARLATEEALTHHRRALERSVERDRKWVVIALNLGHALRHCGERDQAWRVFHDAVAVVRALDEPTLLARVALSLFRTDGFDDDGELLGEAYAKLIGGTGASTDTIKHELTVHLALNARKGGDDDELAFSLWARHEVIWGPGSAAERLALTEEMLAVSRRSADLENEHFATSLRWVALLELDDPRYLDQFHAFVALSERTDQPLFRFMAAIDQSIIIAFLGRFAEAEAMLDQSLELGENHHDFRFMEHHIRWSLLLLQGRFAELDAMHARLTTDDHLWPDLIAGITAAQRGDVEAAREHLGQVKIDERMRHHMAPLRLRLEAQTAAATRDAELCERTRAAIAPYLGQWALSLFGCDIGGPFSLWHGLIDAAQQRWDDAVRHLTEAVESADRMRSRPWSVEARFHLAETLSARGDDATDLFDAVAREAEALGMRHIVERVAQRDRTPAPTDEFRRDGSVWTLGFDGHTAHLPDTKGLRDLHVLLSQPGTAVPAVSLLDTDAVPSARLGGDAVLDDEAKRRYRQRLDQLDGEIDRATELGDDVRAARLDRERAALLEELRTAAGLAGRTRRLGDEAERARKTVTARIRDTLRKLDESHPGLAAHLRATVSTGATCVYQPDGRAGHFRL